MIPSGGDTFNGDSMENYQRTSQKYEQTFTSNLRNQVGSLGLTQPKPRAKEKQRDKEYTELNTKNTLQIRGATQKDAQLTPLEANIGRPEDRNNA